MQKFYGGKEKWQLLIYQQQESESVSSIADYKSDKIGET